MSLDPELAAYLRLIAGRCQEHYSDELRSLVLYGSVARGTFRPGSDVDLLVVLRHSTASWGRRITEFIHAVLDHPEVARAAAHLGRRGLPRRVEPIVLTEKELAARPPIVLDLTEDAVVLEDREGLFAREIAGVRERLREIGARREWLPGDRWYWVLTPEIRPGEVITI